MSNFPVPLRDPAPAAGGSAVHVCNLLTGAFLFLATAAFVFWQNTHLTVLWDLSYILENATRISLGQLPYRDFPFPYAPLTFLAQAAIIKLFGRAVLHHYLYASAASGCATLLTWRILLRLLTQSLLPARLIAFLLSLPLIFLGTSSIFPHPFYDSDCTLFILFCLWLLLRLESLNFPPLPTFATGILLAIPPFIKQNTGLIFLLAAAACIAWIAVRNVMRNPIRNANRDAIHAPATRRACALLLAGAATGFTLALALIRHTVGLANYYHWTIQFAASRRLPGLPIMVGVYRDPSLLWSVPVFTAGIVLVRLSHPNACGRQRSVPHHLCSHPAFRWIAAALLSVPFLWAFAALWIEQNDSDRVEALLHLWPVLLIVSLAFALWQLPRACTLTQLVPLILLAVIHGAFLSQQLWGSTYALWPLLTILLMAILISLASDRPATLPLTSLTFVISLTLLAAGGYYALSHERLQYVDLSGDTLAHSALPPLRGLAMRGDWLPDFEELVACTNREIPPADAILMIPGEDLFYFTTGRTPQFPVLMMDNTVNPYSAAQIAQIARQRNVGWLIVKRNLQLQEEPISFRPQLLQLLSRDYSPVESLNNYDIYRRNPL
ncbi:MAG: hypothetical protein WA532_15640 [Candidatus Korobacteraceae bacterium]